LFSFILLLSSTQSRTMPPSNVAGSRRSSQRRNYSKLELVNFLQIMKEVMPIGGDEWDEVQDRHSLRYPGREVESLRRKFSQLHRKSTPTGDPVCPVEVKLAKRVKYQISSRADVGDGNEEMDLATGTFSTTNVEHDLLLVGEETDTGEENDMEERLVDEVSGEFDAPSVPNDDLLVLANAADPNSNRPSTAEEEDDNDSIKTCDIREYQALPPVRTTGTPTTPRTSTPSTTSRSTTPLPTTPLPTTPTTPTTPTRTRTPGTPSNRGSTSATGRPLVSPYDRRGTSNSKSNPHQDGLAKMMEMSMVQHNQYMEEERQRRGEEREDRKAMHDMLAKVVSGAFESFSRFTNKDKYEDDKE
jgi:hypothetical protein